jgi:peptidoglycan/LPS O-acetylase OafA/YrhL
MTVRAMMCHRDGLSGCTALDDAIMLSLTQALSRGKNNFDLIRLFAALAVMFGHSYVLQLTNDLRDPVTQLFGRESSGSLAVFAFFLMSGILISASFDRQRSVPRFLALRVARIWPALAGCSLFAAFIVGPLFTTWTTHAYFASPATWYFLGHMLTIVHGLGWLLPGVFTNNPFVGAINAAVWTLPLELKCYLVVLAAGAMGLTGTRRGMTLAVIVAFAGFALLLRHPPSEVLLGDLTVLQAGYSFWPVPFFLAGMLLYGWRDQIVLHWGIAFVLAAAYLGLHDTAAGALAFYLAFGYGVLWIGTLPALRRFAPRHDYSYGVYVYGFVIQQCVASIAPGLNHLLAFLIALPIVFACAAFSWHLIESPALRLCRHLIERRSAASKQVHNPIGVSAKSASPE